ncbi:MAG: tail fiber domain-containing protein, partial [Flavobacteriales bacterium]|nr:tail fiber domain-containing protein [Flavobacteriales bacterium]
GNVGIGTTTPQEALTVRTTNTAVYAPVTSLANSLTDLNFRLVTTRGEASNANGAATTQIGQAYGTGTMSEGLRFFRGTTTNDGSLALVTAGSERVRINRIGNVGIGTNNPIAPLHVVPNNLIGYNPLPITYFNYGAGLSTINWTAPGLLAGYFEGNVVCTQGLITTNGALTVSDRRLKKIVGRSDNSRDLALLDRIRVTDYTFIDSIALGNTVQKKVIAQELEEVYPNAIMYKQEHIPDVYTLSVAVRHAEGRLFVTLDKPHGLSEGDHLKWIEENGTAHFDSVACVTDAYTFAIPAEKPQQRIFVWGRRVNDLRTVDYDAVTMLNVSATQELHKLVRDLQVRNEALEQRNSVLDAELEGMRAQLEANTALMLKLQSVLEAQTRK